MYKRIIFILTFFSFPAAFSQQVELTPVLVSSAGSYTEFAWGSISASVGEAVITTVSGTDFYLTQGFHQPNMLKQLVLDFLIGNESCIGSKDGHIVVRVNGGYPPYSYLWSPVNYITDSVAGLEKGNYSVTVTDLFGTSNTETIAIGVDRDELCRFYIYSGFTPNGDGVNETWIIEGIEFYPENHVSIYNRWGNLVWDGNAYDNDNVIWTGNNKKNLPLPTGTYFYIITSRDNVHKGWVELTR
jgi:gliding motility-associated-like protein